MKAKDFLPEGVINMQQLAVRAKELLAKGMTEQQVIQQFVKEGIPERYAQQAVQAGQMNEDKFGTNPKRPARAGSRPPRKHDDRTKQIHQLHGATGWDVSHLELLKPDELDDLHQKHVDQKVAEVTGDPKFDKMLKGITGKKEVAKQQKADTKQQARDAFGGMFGGGNPADKLSIRKKGVAEGEEKFCENCGGSLAENGKASRALCVSGRPDGDLGASNLASCKSQGLRARDGEKSHKLGKTAKSRIKVGGHRIKGNKYGGPLPDWS